MDKVYIVNRRRSTGKISVGVNVCLSFIYPIKYKRMEIFDIPGEDLIYV